MKLDFCLCLLFSSVILVSTNLVDAAGNTTEETCAALNETGCCSTDDCMFFTCVSKNETVQEAQKGCHLDTWNGSDVCKDGTVNKTCQTPASSTAVAPTTPKAPLDCSSYSGKDDCCAVDGCTFVTCENKTSTETIEISECFKNDTDLSTVCKVPPTTNQCNPTSPAPTDVCESYNDTECCKHTDDESCIFISCTDPSDQPHLGCHVNSTDFTNICQDPYKNACTVTTLSPKTKASDVTTQKPTEKTTAKAPDSDANTGSGDKGGQSFDAASFIGGIVLCAGIVAIIFFGLKFYRAKSEKNYHTL